MNGVDDKRELDRFLVVVEVGLNCVGSCFGYVGGRLLVCVVNGRSECVALNENSWFAERTAVSNSDWI